MAQLHLADPGIGDLELSKYVLRHVVLGHRINHKVLIPGRSFTRPVLVALLLESNIRMLTFKETKHKERVLYMITEMKF